MAGKDPAYYNIIEAFDSGGCPVCALVDKSARKWMEWLLYERVSDPKTRFKLRDSRGFCADHARTMLELGSPLPVAIIYRDIIELVAGDLRSKWPVPKKKAECPACVEASEFEAVYLTAIADNFEDPEMQTRLLKGNDLCLPHVINLLKRLPGRHRAALLDAVLTHLVDLDAELAEIIRKSDYRCTEDFGPEVDAWIRTVRKITGR
jgi:hypothetical protein